MRCHRLMGILIVMALSTGVLLFGKARITAWVTDSLSRLPLDSATVYLMKDGVVIDSVFNELAYIDVPEMNGASGHLSHTLVIPQIGDYEIKAVAPGFLPKSVFFSIRVLEEDKESVIGEFFFHLNYIEKPRSPKFPTERLSMKAVEVVDSFNIEKDARLIQLIKQFPGVSLEEDNHISLHGDQVESIRINGKDIGRDDLPPVIRDISVGNVDRVVFYQRELKYTSQKTGPLVMNVVLKKGVEDNDIFQVKEGNVGNVWLWLAGFVFAAVVIASLIYLLKIPKRHPAPLEDILPSSEPDNSDTDEVFFRRAFVKRNINGASEEEFKILESFVGRMDPDFYRSLAAMNLKERDFYDALLIRLGVGLSECGNVLGCSASALGMSRLRAFRGLGDKKGFPRWEDYILSYSSKREKD